jgi:hypothetical protein
MTISRRGLIAAGLALEVSGRLPAAQPLDPGRPQFYAPTSTGEPRGKPLPRRTARTTRLFKTPPSYPNALFVVPEGVWVAEQGSGRDRERIWLLDWEGAVRKGITSESMDTSGVAYGNGMLWVCANGETNQGIYQTDLNSRTISHRQIPLGPPDRGGGCHGATWYDGHLWVTANRARAILKIDPKHWTVDYLIPFALPDGLTRYHGCAVLDGSMYMVSGGESKTYDEGQTNLIKYDLATGTIQEIIDFAPGSCDPHGLGVHRGQLVGCDSGDHPGWDKPYHTPGWGPQSSPTAGYVFSIELGELTTL